MERYRRTAAAAVIGAILFAAGCSPSPAGYPTGSSDRGWRWPAALAHGGRHLNPPGTFGVLHIWLGAAPVPPKTRADQIADVAAAVNAAVDGPITFLVVTWVGAEENLDHDFYAEFLDMGEPQLIEDFRLGGLYNRRVGYAADPTQVRQTKIYGVDHFILNSLNPGASPPELSAFRFELNFTDDSPGREEGSVSGRRAVSLYVNRALPASESQIVIGKNDFADLFVTRVADGGYWKHWTIFPLYWEGEKQFAPPDDAARTPAGAALFSHAGSLHMVWGAQARGMDFRAASLAAGGDPTAFTPADERRAIISPVNGEPIGSNDPPAAAVFRDRIFLAWTTRENRELRILRSADAAFSTSRTQVWRFGDLHGIAPGPALVNAGNRKLIVAHGGEGDLASTIYIRESSDGNSWSDPRPVADVVTRFSRLSLAYVGFRTALVYVKFDGVYLIYSDDDGATWSDEQRIENYPTDYLLADPAIVGVAGGNRAAGLWEDIGDAFYLFHAGSRVAAFRSDRTSFRNLTWRYIGVGNGRTAAIYFDDRFFVVSVNEGEDNMLRLCVSPRHSEIALPVLFAPE